MVLITMLITSCEQENIAQENNDFQKSATFDAETTYWSILGNTESGMDQFNALTNEQKQDVWEFKYDRFIGDNSLSSSQLAAVNIAKDYVEVLDFSEPEYPTDLFKITVNQVFSAFESNQSVSLMFGLDNSDDTFGDVSNNQNQTEADRYTGFTYQLDSPCHAQVIGGEVTDTPVETVTIRRYRRGKLIESRQMDVPCGTVGFQTAN